MHNLVRYVLVLCAWLVVAGVIMLTMALPVVLVANSVSAEYYIPALVLGITSMVPVLNILVPLLMPLVLVTTDTFDTSYESHNFSKAHLLTDKPE